MQFSHVLKHNQSSPFRVVPLAGGPRNLVRSAEHQAMRLLTTAVASSACTQVIAVLLRNIQVPHSWFLVQVESHASSESTSSYHILYEPTQKDENLEENHASS